MLFPLSMPPTPPAMPPHEWDTVGGRRWCKDCGSFQVLRSGVWLDAMVGPYPGYAKTDLSKHIPDQRETVMKRPTMWRVRVQRAMEVFVDVQATSAEQAEAEAAKVPGVVSVFGKSAIRVDQANRPEPPAGVEDGEDQ